MPRNNVRDRRYRGVVYLLGTSPAVAYCSLFGQGMVVKQCAWLLVGYGQHLYNLIHPTYYTHNTCQRGQDISTTTPHRTPIHGPGTRHNAEQTQLSLAVHFTHTAPTIRRTVPLDDEYYAKFAQIHHVGIVNQCQSRKTADGTLLGLSQMFAVDRQTKAEVDSPYTVTKRRHLFARLPPGPLHPVPTVTKSPRPPG